MLILRVAGSVKTSLGGGDVPILERNLTDDRGMSTRGGDAPGGGAPQRESLWRRITGRPQLETAMRTRYEPYSYEPNSKNLRWVVIALAVWMVAAIALAVTDRATLGQLEEFEAQGIRAIPPASRTAFDSMLEFAAAEGFDCTSREAIVEQLASGAGDCGRVHEIVARFESAQFRTYGVFIVMLVTLIVTAFVWGAMVNRASRNLLTLRSAGQRYSPDSTVMWTVAAGAAFSVTAPFGPAVFVGSCVAVIVLGLKVLPAMAEMFKGSDPAAGVEDDQAWRRKGVVPGHVFIWVLFSAAVFLLNPISTDRFFSVLVGREDLSDLINAVGWIVWADLLLILPAAAAIVMLMDLNKRQQARHAIVGDIVVSQPKPEDPFKVELEKSVARKEARSRQGIRVSGPGRKKKK